MISAIPGKQEWKKQSQQDGTTEKEGTSDPPTQVTGRKNLSYTKDTTIVCAVSWGGLLWSDVGIGKFIWSCRNEFE